MSEFINQTNSKFLMKKSNKEKALKELIKIKKIHNLQWMDVDSFKKAMASAGFLLGKKDSYYNEIEYNYDVDCVSNLDILKAIAPYVEEGSFIEFKSEGGRHWRYVFTENTIKTIYPQITWNMPNEYEEPDEDIER